MKIESGRPRKMPKKGSPKKFTLGAKQYGRGLAMESKKAPRRTVAKGKK